MGYMIIYSNISLFFCRWFYLVGFSRDTEPIGCVYDYIFIFLYLFISVSISLLRLSIYPFIREREKERERQREGSLFILRNCFMCSHVTVVTDKFKTCRAGKPAGWRLREDENTGSLGWKHYRADILPQGTSVCSIKAAIWSYKIHPYHGG